MMIRKAIICFAALIAAVVLCLDTTHGRYSINRDSQGVAIKGYDVVAYFSQGKAVEGVEGITYEWKGAVWRFATMKHRDLFIAEPEKYAPQFGGYCAYGIADGKIFDVDPQAWEIKDGKLYLAQNRRAKQTWVQDYSVFLEEANKKWPGILNANE